MEQKRFFDISPMRYLEYSKELKYHDVLETQAKLTEAINATAKAENEAGNVNSIVKLLALDSAAIIPNIETGKRETLEIGVLHSEMRALRSMLEETLMGNNRKGSRNSLLEMEYERISKEITRLENTKIRMSSNQKHEVMRALSIDAESLMEITRDEGEHRILLGLMKRIDKIRHDLI